MSKQDLKETVIKEKEELNFEFNDANINKYLVSINDKRGRSGYEPLMYIRHLTKLLNYVKDFETKIDLIVGLIKIRFEGTQVIGESVMTLDYWQETCGNMCLLLAILNEHPTYFIKEGFTEDVRHERKTSEEDYKAQANIISYMELLDLYLNTGLKGEEPKSTLYVQWLRNEVKLLLLAEDVFAYYKRANVIQGQTRIAIILLDRLHYKHDSLLQLMREKGNKATGREYYLETNMRGKIEALASLVYEHGSEKQQIKAAMYQTFHHCLHDRYYEGKQLFILSRMSQQQLPDIHMQILYNRTQVQLGLAAFQGGDTEATLECLSDIVGTNRLKELLAQAVSARKDKSAKQELEEKQRLLPYHMHLNIDLVEAAYLISAMLFDVPEAARQRPGVLANPVTRHFRKVMQDFERKNVISIYS